MDEVTHRLYCLGNFPFSYLDDIYDCREVFDFRMCMDLLFFVSALALLMIGYDWSSQVDKAKKREIKRKLKKKYKKKHVFITGGNSGLGFAIANLFAERGANVTISGRSPDRLTLAENMLLISRKKKSQIIKTVTIDYEALVSNKDQLRKSIEAAESTSGPIDILICCAGRGGTGLFGTLLNKYAEDLMTVNYWGVYKTIEHILPSMKRRDSGHIVAISSHCTLRTFAGYSAINPAKMAVDGLMETLHAELKDSKLKIQLFNPPPMDTHGRDLDEVSKPETTKEFEKSLGVHKVDAVASDLLNSMDGPEFNITKRTPSNAIQLDIHAKDGWFGKGDGFICFSGRVLALWWDMLNVHVFTWWRCTFANEDMDQRIKHNI